MLKGKLTIRPRWVDSRREWEWVLDVQDVGRAISHKSWPETLDAHINGAHWSGRLGVEIEEVERTNRIDS